PGTIDFPALAAELLARAEQLAAEWLPGGRRDGAEWRCGSLRGEPGDSFAVNVRTGVWSEFAPGGESGGDLISLYAAIHSMKQGEAAKELADQIGFAVQASAPRRPTPAPQPEKQEKAGRWK